MSLEPTSRRAGWRLRQARKDAGKSQAQLGHALGFSTGKEISLIELGKRPVMRWEYGRLAAEVGKTVDELFGELGSPMEPTRTSGGAVVGPKGSGSAEVVPGDSGH